MVSLKTTKNTFELFLSDRDYLFDKKTEISMRKKLKEYAKKKYAEMLKNEKRMKLRIILLLLLDLKKRGCIKVNLLYCSL